MNPLVWFIVVLVTFLVSHLSVDKDFPEGLKVGAWIVFSIVAILYILFGLIF